MNRPPAIPVGGDPLAPEPQFERFLLDQVEAAVVATDSSGAVTTWNRFAEELLGYRADEALGMNFVDLLVGVESREAVQGIFEGLASGERWQGDLDVVARDGATVPVRMRSSPVLDAAGIFVGTASVLVDVTEFRRLERRREAALEEAERTREQLQFLAEAGATLTSSLDYGKTMNKLVKLAVPKLADWCSVEVLEEGEIRAVAVAHSDAELLDSAWELRRRWPLPVRSPTGAPEVIRSGTSQLFERVTDDMLRSVALADNHLTLLRALGPRSAIVVPLRARGRTFGAVTYISTDAARTYGPADVSLAEALAERAAQAADNARLYQERTRVARALQQSLLPQQLPRIDWMEVAARYRAAGEFETGGDFYDVFEASDGAWFAAIGDVQGKGPEAAAVTGLARHTIRAAAVSEPSPRRILRTLNQAIVNEWTDRFATVALARIRRSNGAVEVAVSSGGHPLPLILRASGEIEPTECKGNLLGAFEEVQLADQAIELRPGDALVMYTDGVTEEQAGKRVFGEDRLLTLLRSLAGSDAETIAQRIEQAVLDFGDPEPRDDMAVLVLRNRPGVAPTPEPV